MGRIRNRATIVSVVAIISALGLISVAGDSVSYWLKFHFQYPEYLHWKRDGGPWMDTYFEPLVLDRKRNDMVESLSYEEVRAKFPFLVDGDTFPESSYKGEYLIDVRRHSADAKVLWFSAADGFDWCVEFQGRRGQLHLIKG